MKLGKTFKEIKQECLRERRLFEDADFPATNKSVFPSKRPPKPFEWKRPGVSSLLFSIGVVVTSVGIWKRFFMSPLIL